MDFGRQNAQREEFEALLASLKENNSREMIENLHSTKARLEGSCQAVKPQEIAEGKNCISFNPTCMYSSVAKYLADSDN